MNPYVMNTLEEFLDDPDIKGVELRFRQNRFNSTRSRNVVCLSKETYIEILNDVRAWKYIIFTHPMMRTDIKTKLNVSENGILIDDTPYKYGTVHREFMDYFSYFKSEPTTPYTTHAEDVDIYTAYSAMLDLGGSDKMCDIYASYKKYLHELDNKRYSNPANPEDDKDGLYNWKLKRHGEDQQDGYVYTCLISNHYDDEPLFWAKKRKLS